MSDENQCALYKAHRDAQDKYAYFLLAAAGAAIGFAATQTREATLAWSHAPLALAVLCWAASFYSGCGHLQYGESVLYSNTELLRVLGGTYPMSGTHPQAIQKLRAAMDRNSIRAGVYGRWQFRLLVAGAVLYVLWHTLEMYLRAIW